MSKRKERTIGRKSRSLQTTPARRRSADRGLHEKPNRVDQRIKKRENRSERGEDSCPEGKNGLAGKKNSRITRRRPFSQKVQPVGKVPHPNAGDVERGKRIRKTGRVKKGELDHLGGRTARETSRWIGRNSTG